MADYSFGGSATAGGGAGGAFYHRTQSQTRHQQQQDFPNFHSSHRTTSNAVHPPPPPPPPHHRSSITAATAHLPPPYSSASLGPTFRSRSLDHRQFPAAFEQSQVGQHRAIYTSQQSGLGGTGGRNYGRQKYTGELFGGVGGGATMAESGHFRSSSTEKSGVTVVPIRRDSTLPARQFHSEWKSEWKSGGGGGILGGVGGPSLIQRQIAQQQRKEAAEEAEAKEEYQVERSTKFSQNRQAWNKPRENFYDRWHRMEMIEAPRSGYYPPAASNADYSTFQRSRQIGRGDAEAEAAAQHQQHHQQTRTQQHEKQYREWHSGGRHHQRSAAATGAAADHYGTLGTRRSATERYGARGTGAAYQQAAEGGGGGQRYQNYQHQQQQQQYANGWGGGGHHHYQNQQQHHHMRRSASAGGTGFFGTGQKSKSSKSSGARWSAAQRTSAEQRGPKRYRKIRLCCFNLIWPPWAVEPSGPPRSLYGRSKASGGPPTPIPLEHRPFYTAEGPLPAAQTQPPPTAQITQQQQIPPPAGGQSLPGNDVGARGGYPRGPPGVPEPPEYRAPPPGHEYRGGGGADYPDYGRGGGGGRPAEYRGEGGGAPPPEQAAAHFQHSREVPVRHEVPQATTGWQRRE